MQRFRCMAIATAVVLAVLHGGCGGHGGGAFTRILRGVVTEADFRIAAGERVGAEGDVVVQCQTADIAGELVSLASTGAGANGGSITIEAQGDIVITGAIASGAGTDGANTANGANGGRGGNVTLTSANGEVTLGVAVAAAGEVRTKQAGGGSLQSGDGGNGSSGLFGGAGGNGGDITINCPNGTWHIHPGPNMLVFGNGGNGGDGRVPEAQLESVTIPEVFPNAGGNSGGLRGEVGAVEGVTLRDVIGPNSEPWTIADVPAGAVSGGKGGAAGSAKLGDEVATTQQRDSRAPREPAGYHCAGAHGGDGAFQGGAGAAVDCWYVLPVGLNASATGGDGGHAGLSAVTDLELLARARKMGVGDNVERIGGNGGDATAEGAEGTPGGAGANGGNGGTAVARGGDGGSALDSWAAPGLLQHGDGGCARADGGKGGQGGAGSATSAAGNGGDGGFAEAWGGSGGTNGRGGNADARAGNGGGGGDGNPPGTGGAGARATAVGGDGDPNGSDRTTQGRPGPNGVYLAPPGQRVYNVLMSQSTNSQALIKAPWYTFSERVLPSSARATTNLPVPANVMYGETAQVNAAASKLWLATFEHIRRLDNFRTSPVQGATFQSGTSDIIMISLWVDEARDLLYGLAHSQQRIFVWTNASTATGNRSPARTIDLAGKVLVSLCGDSTSDRLYARTNQGGNQSAVLVLDGASTRSGATTADRTLTGFAFDTYSTGLAYARQQDALYVGLPQAVGRVSQAATRDGAVTPVLLQGAATGITDQVVSLDVIGDSNLLFVADFYQALLLFENASALGGNVGHAKRDANVTQINGVAAFPEP